MIMSQTDDQDRNFAFEQVESEYPLVEKAVEGFAVAASVLAEEGEPMEEVLGDDLFTPGRIIEQHGDEADIDALRWEVEFPDGHTRETSLNGMAYYACRVTDDDNVVRPIEQ